MMHDVVVVKSASDGKTNARFMSGDLDLSSNNPPPVKSKKILLGGRGGYTKLRTSTIFMRR